MLGDEVRSASEDLLYLTRIADGTLDIRRTDTTVGRILSGVLPRLQRIARAHESEILSVHVDEEASLFTDARLLMRALRGFIERPLQDDSVTVTLTATLSGDCVRFVVIDSAAVSDASILEQVLQPDSVTKAQSGEFVLPKIEHLPTMLAVHLFRALGGHVELQSSPGMGTQVTLTLLS
ncbi:MAG: HAMP domain-containing histidine kinase [Proteobacteria bacterium]|nr:HAMP domain-containing histidine kinase [Pseudomonadota bacterium]